MRGTYSSIFLLFTICASPAFGAGYGLKEHSADAMAAAYAGAAATSSDASYLAYNPASLAGVSDSDFAVNAVAIFPGSKSAYTSATTSAGTPTGGDLTPRGYISGAVVPAFAFRARLTDQWAIGLDVSAPWGLKTDYPAGWAGRYYAEKTQLLTINATPAVSWQPMPGLALGVGVQVEYAQGKLTTAIDTGTLGALNGIPGSLPGGQDSFAQLDGTNWTFGFTLGAMAKLSGDLTAGLSYRSSLQHDLEGPLTFTLDSTGTGAAIRSLTGLFTDTHATVPLTMPDMVSFGLRDRLADDWYGMIELDWTHWSRFRELRISAANPAQPDNVTTTHWHNAMFGSIGFEYHASESLSLRGGIAYDQSPVPDATREPRIPDSDRIWLSAGVRYRLSDDMDVNVTLSRLFFLKSDVALVPTIPGAALRGTLTGTAQAYANVAGLQFSYRTE